MFGIRFRIEPSVQGVSVDPERFETTLYREAEAPGEDGWLFFRDHLWRGEVGESEYFRELAEEMLGTTVTSVSFSELRTDEAYLEGLRVEIGENLEEFKSESVDEALTKYLGSSIRVVSEEN
ncbi:MAG: LWR-salt protein [Haloarculaceae archaeon]